MTGQRLIAVFVVGCLLLNYPLLYLFSRDLEVAGVPLLFIYVFAAWTLLIALIALAVKRSNREG